MSTAVTNVTTEAPAKIKPPRSLSVKQKLKKADTSRKSPLFMSIQEKMCDVDINPTTGVVTHRHLISDNGKDCRTFPSTESYKKWLSSQKLKMRATWKYKLTPHQWYVT